jgi:type I restriction enzyme M protein
MNVLAQFFTPDAVTMHIIGGVSTPKPQKMLDLGVGRGCLLYAAHRRWPMTHLMGVDVDINHVNSTQCRLPTADLFHADALRYDLPKLLGIEIGSIDLAVGNPPYGRFQVGLEHERILAEADLANTVSRKRITREVVFLAQNLRMLCHGGELVLILPEGIGTNQMNADLRRALISNHGLWRVLELPPHLFQGTEAKTLAFFLKKGNSSRAVRLERWNDSRHIIVSPADATKRVDASFHLASSKSNKETNIKLSELDPEIKRGILTQKEAIKLGARMFHTTDFKRYPDGQADFSSTLNLPPRWLAEEGDILIPRVGSRCLAHTLLIKKGQTIFTDCVYRIRVSSEYRDSLFRYLRSSKGIAQRLAFAHGVCAQVLSKRDLLQLKLPAHPFDCSHQVSWRGRP